jgi:hypothetical protein
MAATQPYPARLDAALDEPLSRWLWLVKWFLAIPHFIALFFLWLAALLLTFAAGVAILFTGRYPRGIFDFNVGVLRWSWRVQHYAFVLGTDRYPRFTLQASPDDRAQFAVDYPEQGLSRGLVLVKWWLLAIPHYLIVAIFGGGLTLWSQSTEDGRPLLEGGLISLLALIAGVILLFTGRYQRSLFDLVLGMERWTYRVAAYAMLMRDEYPPFRLDTGGTDPGSGPSGGIAATPPESPHQPKAA